MQSGSHREPRVIQAGDSASPSPAALDELRERIDRLEEIIRVNGLEARAQVLGVDETALNRAIREMIHICNVERIGKEVEVIDDERIAEMLDRYEALKPAAKEYAEIDKELKTVLEGRKALIGSWFVDGKYREFTSYEIPEDVKSQYKKVKQVWFKKILKVA